MAREPHSSQNGELALPPGPPYSTGPQSQLGAEQTHAETRAVRRGWTKHQTFKGVTLNGRHSLRAETPDNSFEISLRYLLCSHNAKNVC